MENQNDETLAEVTDVVLSPSNSSNGGSLAYVGDVDERDCAENAQGKTGSSEFPKRVDNQDSDDDSFVVVDAVEGNDDLKELATNAAAEAKATMKAEEEATAKAAAEAKAKMKAEEEIKKKAEEELAAKAAAEAKKKAEKEAAEAEAKKKAKEEVARVAAEAEATKRAEEEAATKANAKAKAAAEAEMNKKAEEQTSKNKADEEASAKAKADAEAKIRATNDKDHNSQSDGDDDLDLDALLDDSIDGNPESDMNENGDQVEDSNHEEIDDKEDLPKPSMNSGDNEDDLDLDALLDDSVDGNDESGVNSEKPRHDPIEEEIKVSQSLSGPSTSTESGIPSEILTIEQSLEQSLAEAVREITDDKPAGSNIKDAEALELDALLDDSDDEEDSQKIDSEVKEDKVVQDRTPSRVPSKTSTKKGTYPIVLDRKGTNGEGRIAPKSMGRIRSEKTSKNTREKDSVGARKKTPAKKSMEEAFNVSSSINDTLSNSKKKIMTARDRMKEYSRELSSRASNQIRKNTKPSHRGNERKVDSTPRFMSPKTKRLFTSSILTSTTRRVGGEIDGEEQGKRRKPQWGENTNKKDFRHFMKTTAAFTNNVIETKNNWQRKTELKEMNAKKILVNVTPWKMKTNPVQAPWKMKNTPVQAKVEHDDTGLKQMNRSAPRRVSDVTSGTVSSITRAANTLLTRRQKMQEREREMERRSPRSSPKVEDKRNTAPFSFLISPHRSPKVTETIVFTKDGSKNSYESPARSYAAQSVGSLSSLCTVQSFVSPVKEGIAGCQNRYEPFLHSIRGPCELCVFRLSDTEKEKLDAQGRHFMVQFTTGGCRDCSAFPKSVGELPVRLCQKCYTNSHRRVQTRRRKKGNGSHIGYSFAKVSEGMIR